MRDNAREYCIRPESDEAFVISFLGNDQVHALGFDEDAEKWIKFYSTDMEYSDEAFEEFEDEISSWAETHYQYFTKQLDDADLVVRPSAK